MKDESIIRNRMKIEATIENARRIKVIQREMGSFAEWLKSHHPKRKDEWVKLFKKTFVFTGGEIVGEFLMSIGYLPGAHHAGCPTYKRIAKLKPAWSEAEKKGFRYCGRLRLDGLVVLIQLGLEFRFLLGAFLLDHPREDDGSLVKQRSAAPPR